MFSNNFAKLCEFRQNFSSSLFQETFSTQYQKVSFDMNIMQKKTGIHFRIDNDYYFCLKIRLKIIILIRNTKL